MKDEEITSNESKERVLKPLPVTENTRNAMWQFFYKTSIPRIIAKKKLQEKNDSSEEDP